MQRLRASSPFYPRRRGQSAAVCAGGRVAGRAQLAAQHCPRDGYLAGDDCQPDKKKRKRLRRRSRACAPKRTRKRSGKRWSWMKCGPSWAARSAKSGCGWPSNGPAGASWPGCWADGTRPRPGACGWLCLRATTAIAGILPTCGRPTWRCCPAGTIAAAPRAAAEQVLSKPSTVRYASAVGCSCENLVPSASR